MSWLKDMIPPIHHEGYLFIIIFVVASVLLGIIAEPLAVFGGILTLFCIFFFRDPVRLTPDADHLIISPADGRVVKVEKASPPAELDMEEGDFTKISIFLSVFNVHVNRVPASGTISKLHYRPGKFINAAFDKASEDNERQSVRMMTHDGHDVAFVQIAGLIARRIVCDLEEGQKVDAGQRFGIIRFGSRMDVYLPSSISVSVAEGQTVIGGETVLADLTISGEHRKAVER